MLTSPIDLNDATTLEFYNQLLLFKNNIFEEEVLFRSPDKLSQRTLQALAHKLDLEYEYSVATRTLRISRSIAEDMMNSVPEYGSFINNDLLDNVGGAFEGIIGTSGETSREALPGDFSLQISQAELDVLSYDFVSAGSQVNGDIDPVTAGSGLNSASSSAGPGQQSIANPEAWAQIGRVGSLPRDISGHESLSTPSAPILDAIHDPDIDIIAAIHPGNTSTSPVAIQHISASRKRKDTERSISPVRNGSQIIGFSPRFRPYAPSPAPVSNVVTSPSDFHMPLMPLPDDHRVFILPESIIQVNDAPTSDIDSERVMRPLDWQLFSRRASVQATTTSPYQEIVFDSRSDRSGSQASINSSATCASGRRGPLSEWAKAGMQAVKRIGACWRCKL